MIELVRTDSSHPAFRHLVILLDADLAKRDGHDHAFYAQFNKIDAIKHSVVAFENSIAIGCGAIKSFDSNTMEVKRMFVLPQYRGQGVGGKILAALEEWTRELSFNRCVLETGKRQPEAIALYRRGGYQVIPNYGQYNGKENSICFEKSV